MRCRLQIVLIATTIWLPVQANGKSVFVGIDGRAHTSAEIDATITHVMHAAEVPGLGLALINDGKVVYLKAYGVKNMSPNEPLTVNSVMVAGSLTKVAFAYLVMKLVDDHVIDLDKPVYEYLPRPLSDYPTWRDIANDPRSKLITTRMLLSHTAGFNNSRYFDPDHRLVIHFQPGTRYSYGSEGYSLIQLVVETVTKKSTEELMQQQVFGPLGMTRTSMVWQNAFESDHANGYDEYGRSLGIQKRQTAQGAGSMQTTLTDYARLTQAVLFGRGLRKQTHAQMLSAQIPIVSKFEFPPLLPDTTDEYKGIQLSYGLGVGLYHTPLGWAFFKEGHDEGWRTYVVCHQNQATCMVILTNSSNGEGIYSALLRGLCWVTPGIRSTGRSLPRMTSFRRASRSRITQSFRFLRRSSQCWPGGTARRTTCSPSRRRETISRSSGIVSGSANFFLRPGRSSFPRTATKLSRFCSISTPGLSGSSEKWTEKAS